MRHLLTVIPITFMLSACVLTDLGSSAENAHSTNSLKDRNFHQQNTLHRHVEKLARQLLSSSNLIDNVGTVAIGTILPALQENGDPLPQSKMLGLQIQESLMTFATQAGLQVVDFKTMPTIKITSAADKMLSREVEDLNSNISADYFLTGTYTKQENSTIVNIRLVQLPDNIVLAAATDYIPNDTMWSSSKVTLKNNQIYRSAY
ncbi:FlgO family outer membrane protein [Paraglaciecola sp.]|uniref:FlgO family outer membrane protein n=1 Tax=Paraglaciecola sp. TaxID=1920173 RepID=UPI003EF7FE0E